MDTCNVANDIMKAGVSGVRIVRGEWCVDQILKLERPDLDDRVLRRGTADATLERISSCPSMLALLIFRLSHSRTARAALFSQFPN